MVNIPYLIEKKRDGKDLSKEEIDAFIKAVVDGSIQDAQIGAILMAIYLKGMTVAETVALTSAMSYSGEVFNFPKEWNNLLVDKHSTGGIGDKISLVLAPALATFGLKVPMVSGRGLAFTGGTLDKLESIPGFQTQLTQDKMSSCLESSGCFIASATGTLAPADAVLYKQRDITSTVGCIPLIVSSILSKKVAEGTKALVMDVKVGRATFLKTEEAAREIAELLVKISDGLGVVTRVVLSRMDVPIGRAIGNAVEVIEAVECLKGEGPDDIQLLVCTLGSVLLLTKGIVKTMAEGETKMKEALTSGSALKRFHTMIQAQGVGSEVAQQLCYGDSNKLFPSTYRTNVTAERHGYITDINALTLGLVIWKLGAGREKASDSIDHSVGLLLKATVGQEIIKGQPWVEVLHSSKKLPLELVDQLQTGITISQWQLEQPPLIIDII